MHRIASQIRTLEADVAEVYELLAPRDNPTFTGTVSGLNKTMVGLSNVDNTSDANKPISTLTQNALNDKANAADVYTKTQTDNKITELIDGAPNALNTLRELASAINNDAAYATNIVSSLAAKADKENPILTGTVKVSDMGTLTPNSAKLHVFGGVKNVANEDSAIRASSWANSIKVELENTATNGKLYELRSNNNGNFEIMDRTGSASRYEISSSGSHTIKGNTTVNGDFNVVNNGTSTNILTALNNKQTLVNPSVDIPNWLQLQSDYLYYFSDPVAPILRLKTDNIAPKTNPAFTGDASVVGNLAISGELSVDKIKLHSTTPGSRIEFPDGVLFSNNVSLAGNRLLATNAIAPSSGSDVNIQGDLIITGGATISNPNKSLTVQNLTVENLSIGDGKINQSKVAGLEDALDGKQSIISVINGIQDYLYPQDPLYYQELPTPVGELQLPRTQLKLNMNTIQSKLTFSTPPTNGFSLLNNSTVRGLVYDSPITLAVDGNENLHVGLDQSNLQPKLTFSSPPANGLSLLSGSTVRGLVPAAPITLEVNGYGNIQVGLDQANLQSKLTFKNPIINGFSLLNGSTVRGLVYDSPITLAVDGNDNLHVGLDQSNLQPKLTFSAPPANGFSLLNGSTTVRGITCTSPITLVVDNDSNLKLGIDPIALTDMTISSNVLTDLSADKIAARTAVKITMQDAVDIEGILSVDSIKSKTAAAPVYINDALVCSGSITSGDLSANNLSGAVGTFTTHVATNTIRARSGIPPLITLGDPVAASAGISCNGLIDVIGGTAYAVNEQTAVRVSGAQDSINIELRNTATSGKGYELASTNTGTFQIRDQTAGAFRYSIDTGGNHTFAGNLGMTTNGVIYTNTITNLEAPELTIDCDAAVNGALLTDTIKARVAQELTIDDNVVVSGVLLADTIRSSVASELTLDDNVHINQDLVCDGTLRLGSASSAGKVVIAGGPQNLPNEETALRIAGSNSSIKMEMENLNGGKKV